MGLSTHTRTHAHTHKRTRTHALARARAHTHTHTHTHTHINSHTHAHTQLPVAENEQSWVVGGTDAGELVLWSFESSLEPALVFDTGVCARHHKQTNDKQSITLKQDPYIRSLTHV